MYQRSQPVVNISRGTVLKLIILCVCVWSWEASYLLLHPWFVARRPGYSSARAGHRRPSWLGVTGSPRSSGNGHSSGNLQGRQTPTSSGEGDTGGRGGRQRWIGYSRGGVGKLGQDKREREREAETWSKSNLHCKITSASRSKAIKRNGRSVGDGYLPAQYTSHLISPILSQPVAWIASKSLPGIYSVGIISITFSPKHLSKSVFIGPAFVCNKIMHFSGNVYGYLARIF